MTRIAGYSYRGTHVALPEKPSRASDCYITNGVADAGTIAAAVSSITWLRGKGFITPAIRRAAIFSLVAVPFYFVRPRIVKRIVEQRGETVQQKKTPLIQNVGTSLDWDDFVIGGIILGLAAAANPNFPTTVRTYQKFLGLASLGAASASSMAELYPPLRKQSREFANGPQKQSVAWLIKKPITLEFPGGAIGATADFKLGGSRSADAGSVNAPDEVDSFTSAVPEMAGNIAPQVKSIQKPHLARFTDGSMEFIARTDYTWSPPSQQEGLAVLRQHIQELTETLHRRRLAANYLWMKLSAKEIEFYLSHDPSKHNKLREELEWLSELHSSCYTEMADLSWMIADSQKNVKQMQEGGLDGSTSSEARRQTLTKVHDGIVTSMCKDPLIRMDTVSDGMRYINEQVRGMERMCRGIIDQYIEAIKQSNEGAQEDVDWKEVRASLERHMDSQPMGQVLALIRKLAGESSDELSKLREEHWSGKKE